MTSSHDPARPQAGRNPREPLEDSFDKATETEPKTFREEANADKQVEIPEDKTDHPIRGIDAPEQPGR